MNDNVISSLQVTDEQPECGVHEPVVQNDGARKAEARIALDRIAAAVHAHSEIELPQVALARSAAYLISTVEGASLHLERIRKRANDFDPAVRAFLQQRRAQVK